MIDFTNCRIIPGRAYNGANGSKIAVEFNGEIYMLKFPPSGEKKPTNSCISEHIASSIFNMLGIRAQETVLGTFTVKGKKLIQLHILQICKRNFIRSILVKGMS